MEQERLKILRTEILNDDRGMAEKKIITLTNGKELTYILGLGGSWIREPSKRFFLFKRNKEKISREPKRIKINTESRW